MSRDELVWLAALAAGVYLVSMITAGPAGPAGAPGRRQKSERSRRIEERIADRLRVMPEPQPIKPQPKKKYYWYMGKRITEEELEKLRRSHMEYQRRLHEYSMYKRFYEGPVEALLHYPALDLRLRSYQAKLRIAEVMREIQGMRARPMIRYVDVNSDGFAECIRFEIYSQDLKKRLGERLVCA